MTISYFKLITIRLAIVLSSIINASFANAVNLIPDVDYFYGNGRGEAVAEKVSNYVHKHEKLDFFARCRIDAVMELHSALGGTIASLEQFETHYPLLPINAGYTADKGEIVNFFTQLGLKKCQVFLINGKFYKYNEEHRLVLYNSVNDDLNTAKGDIIVMDQKGNIFIHPKNPGWIHHSSFFSQKGIAFGAMVRIKNGEIVNADGTKDELIDVNINPGRYKGNWPSGLLFYSGHYDPDMSKQENQQKKRDALNYFKAQLNIIHFEEDNTNETDDSEDISQSAEDSEELSKNNECEMTLCFKNTPGNFMDHDYRCVDDAALLFKNSTSTNMAYLVQNRCLCGLIHNNNQVVVTDYELNDYDVYRTWKLSNSEFKKGLDRAYEDAQKEDGMPYLLNSVMYAVKIMNTVGLNVKLGYWSATPNNLKDMIRK